MSNDVLCIRPTLAARGSMQGMLKEARGTEPGWVEMRPRNRATFHVRVWLSQLHTAFKYHCASNRGVRRGEPEMRNFSDSMMLLMQLSCTVYVWNSSGGWPMVSGC